MEPVINTYEAYREAKRQERIAEAAAARVAYPDGPPIYQRNGMNFLRGYLNNPLNAKGWNEIREQFWEAPLGGHIRRIGGKHGRIIEQGTAGVLATGLGAAGFLAAADALNGSSVSTPQTPETIPLA